MSEDEDCDELPMITVNTSVSDSSMFAMPSAEELATQRARELQCEEELRQLRERAAADERGSHAELSERVERPAPLAHSDSSSSESEAVLAQAVTALSVAPRGPGPGRGPGAGPDVAALCAALAPHVPHARALLAALGPEPRHLDHMVDSVSAALATPAGEWHDDALQCAAALLCVAQLARAPLPAPRRARPPPPARRVARLAHALLDDRAAPTQVDALSRALLAAFPSHSARMALSDAWRSGAGALADRLAARLAAAALLATLAPERDGGPARLADLAAAAPAWRRLHAPARYACVQLAGRVLAAPSAPSAPSEREPRRRLLALLAPPAAAPDHQRPDRLKVLVGASKLSLLFRTDQ